MKRTLRRIRKRKSLLRNKYFWCVVFLFSGLTLLFTLLVFSPLLQVQNIQVKGNELVSTQEIETLMWREAERDFLAFPTASILFIDTREIAEIIKETFPPVFEVQVQRAFPHTIIVSAKERKALAAWCSKEQCFSLDREGILFEKREQSEGFLSLSSLQDPVPLLGKKIIPEDLLLTLLDFKKKVEEFPEKAAFSFVSFYLVSFEQVEGITKTGWKAVFNPKENREWQATKLRLVLEETIPQEKRKELEYIDLRFGDQAYIKYRD